MESRTRSHDSGCAMTEWDGKTIVLTSNPIDIREIDFKKMPTNIVMYDQNGNKVDEYDVVPKGALAASESAHAETKRELHDLSLENAADMNHDTEIMAKMQAELSALREALRLADEMADDAHRCWKKLEDNRRNWTENTDLRDSVTAYRSARSSLGVSEEGK